MRNNGKVRDVRSLTIHLNISEIVYLRSLGTRRHVFFGVSRNSLKEQKI